MGAEFFRQEAMEASAVALAAKVGSTTPNTSQMFDWLKATLGGDVCSRSAVLKCLESNEGWEFLVGSLSSDEGKVELRNLAEEVVVLLGGDSGSTPTLKHQSTLQLVGGKDFIAVSQTLPAISEASGG